MGAGPSRVSGFVQKDDQRSIAGQHLVGRVVTAARMARRGLTVTRGLRGLVRRPVTLEESRSVIEQEVRHRAPRLLASLDRLVWPFPASPTRRLLDHAGLEPGDVRALVTDRGVDDALEALRDAGVYVAYEEYHGRRPAVRGSASFEFSPPDFFNPVTTADYLATTGGSRSEGTPVELSFSWQRRQGRQRPLQAQMAGTRGAPMAVWLPVFPSAAGFGAVMKLTAGGSRPERWFSQIPTDLRGITTHKQLANRVLPAMSALARAGLPSPEHVPTSDPAPVAEWLQDAVARTGAAALTGYASSLTALARHALERGIDLNGVVGFPASEPVTAGKLDTMRASGMRPFPMYAFVPEGTMGLSCPHCDDEEYHLWAQDLAVVTRRRDRGDGTEVDAFLWTSLALDAPRVLLNVENDDYGEIRTDVPCACPLGEVGLRTRLAQIRGISKVVAAGMSLDGEVFDALAESTLPALLGGGPGDYQLVEEETTSGTAIALRIHPRVGAIDDDAARAAFRAALAGSDNGVLARTVWGQRPLRIDRAAPITTRAGKTLAFERLGTTPAAHPTKGH